MAAGFAGLVGMVRNWLFTAFYCSAELWGDVVLSLLFWGLANEMTTIEEAPALYPLFGFGANVAPLPHTSFPTVIRLESSRILVESSAGCSLGCWIRLLLSLHAETNVIGMFGA